MRPPEGGRAPATALAGAVADGRLCRAAAAAARRAGGRRLPARGGRRHGGAVQDPRRRRARLGRAARRRALADSGVDLAAFIGTMDKEDADLDACSRSTGSRRFRRRELADARQARRARRRRTRRLRRRAAAWIGRRERERASPLSSWASRGVGAGRRARGRGRVRAHPHRRPRARRARRARARGGGRRNAGGAASARGARGGGVERAQRLCAAGFPAGLPSASSAICTPTCWTRPP